MQLETDNHGGGLAEVLRLSVPASLAMLGRTVTQFADGLMVSGLGVETISAQGASAIVAFVPESFAIGALGVISTFVSQNLGAGRNKKCGTYAWAGLGLVVLFSLLACPLALTAGPLFRAIGHAPRVQQLESMYFRYMILSIPLTMATRVLASFFFGIHRPSIPLIASVVANGFNIAANYALIFGKWGFPEWGLEGAAIGTVVSWALQLLILTAVFLSPRIHRKYGSWSIGQVQMQQCKDIIRVGWPAGVRFCINMITWAIFNTKLVARFGTAHLTAATASIRYMSLSFMPVVGASIAATTLVGRYIGMGRPDLAQKRAHTAIMLAIAYASVCGVAFWLLREPMIALFVTVSPQEAAAGIEAADIIAIGAKIMLCAAVFQVFDAMGIVFSGALRGAGDTLWPMLAAIMLSLVLLVGGGYAMVVLMPELESLGPYLAATAYVIVLGLVIAWRFESGQWRKIDLLNIANS